MMNRQQHVLVIGSRAFARTLASVLGPKVDIVAKPSISLDLFLQDWQPDLAVVDCDGIQYGIVSVADGLHRFRTKPPVIWVSTKRALVVAAANAVVHPAELRERLASSLATLHSESTRLQGEGVELPLGVLKEKVALGSHIAYLWETKQELHSLLHFWGVAGKSSEARVFIAPSKSVSNKVRDVVREGGLNRDKIPNGIILNAQMREVMSGRFEKAAHETISALTAVKRVSRVRAIGFTTGFTAGSAQTNADKHVQLLEKALDKILPELPAVMLCPYQVSKFTARQLMKRAFETHPLIIYKKKLYCNGFYTR